MWWPERQNIAPPENKRMISFFWNENDDKRAIAGKIGKAGLGKSVCRYFNRLETKLFPVKLLFQLIYGFSD